MRKRRCAWLGRCADHKLIRTRRVIRIIRVFQPGNAPRIGGYSYGHINGGVEKHDFGSNIINKV